MEKTQRRRDFGVVKALGWQNTVMDLVMSSGWRVILGRLDVV